MAALPPGFWSALSARASRTASAGRAEASRKTRASLEVEMNPRFQEADAHRPEDKASRADVFEGAAGFDREAQALDTRNEELGAETSQELRAGAAVRAQDAAAEHEVEVEVGFVKEVLEELHADDRVGRRARCDADEAFDGDVAG